MFVRCRPLRSLRLCAVAAATPDYCPSPLHNVMASSLRFVAVPPDSPYWLCRRCSGHALFGCSLGGRRPTGLLPLLCHHGRTHRTCSSSALLLSATTLSLLLLPLPGMTVLRCPSTDSSMFDFFFRLWSSPTLPPLLNYRLFLVLCDFLTYLLSCCTVIVTICRRFAF